MSILKKGMSGVPVKRVQERLKINTDGIYGAVTEKALREFQQSHGLTADGIAGPDTFTAMGLNELVLLRKGIRGDTVRKLQSALGIDADGKFGPGTEKAVREFQKTHGLKVDGMAGPETLANLDGFSDFTEDTVKEALVRADEEKFEIEPIPEVDGTKVVAGSAAGDIEEKSIWGRVKGWFS